MSRATKSRRLWHRPADRDDEPMAAPPFWASVSMALWIIAVCVAMLTVTALAHGWPSMNESQVEQVQRTSTAETVEVPPCGWVSATAARPGERSVTVKSTCPEDSGE